MTTENPHLSNQQKILRDQKGFALYKKMMVGDSSSFAHFVAFEVYQLFLEDLSGALGYGLRAQLAKRLLGKSDSLPIIGKSVSFKCPSKIFLGKNVTLDTYSLCDVRGSGSITLGDSVFVGRQSAIVAKDAHIELSSGVNVGTNCRIASESRVLVGKSTLIAAYCYIGPGNHSSGSADKPLIEQSMIIKGGVEIGEHCWIGTKATILDGVKIGDRAIVGAHSFVNTDIPAGAVAVGTPARIISTN